MDAATFRHHHTSQQGDTFNPLPLTNLTNEEKGLYTYLMQTNARVEQDRVSREWVMGRLFSQ